MFYIHGGEFKFGGKDFYRPDYLLDNEVILVTINYRLGVLGISKLLFQSYYQVLIAFLRIFKHIRWVCTW